MNIEHRRSGRRLGRIALGLALALLVTGCDEDPASGGLDTSSATLEDACSDGFGLSIRYFDTTDGGVWPDGGQVYVTDPGGTSSVSLQCTQGNKICFGATTRGGGSRIWGVGLDGNAGCDGCCFDCGNRLNQRLTCS